MKVTFRNENVKTFGFVASSRARFENSTPKSNTLKCNRTKLPTYEIYVNYRIPSDL